MSSKSSSYKRITIESYDDTVDEYIAKVDKLHPAKESAKFLSFLGEKASILDVGCGPGRDAKIFAEKGYDVTGVDLSKKMIAAAKKRMKSAKFRVMDVMKLDFEDNSFDAIWASAIFLHIKKRDIAQALREAHRAVREGGIFYLSVKEGEGEMVLPDDRYGGVKKFWAFFRKKEIEKFVKAAGFTVIESYISKQKGSYATNPWIHIFCRK